MSWKQSLAEMQRNIAYIRPKVAIPFPRTCSNRSYVHQADLFNYDFSYPQLYHKFKKC
jgi:hypothetical protein